MELSTFRKTLFWKKSKKLIFFDEKPKSERATEREKSEHRQHQIDAKESGQNNFHLSNEMTAILQ